MRLERAERQFRARHDLAHEPRTEAAGANAVKCDVRQLFSESLAAAVGDERDAAIALQERAGECFRGEHVTPGAAGGEHDERTHASTPPKRRRVNAKAM